MLAKVNTQKQEVATWAGSGLLPDERMDFYLRSLKPIAVQKEGNAINSLLEFVGARPYEIWTYNRTQISETNVFLVFYNDDLVSNQFQLLHSNAMGEPKNDKWQKVLSQSGMFVPNHNLDRQPVRDRLGTPVANPHWENR